MLARFEAWRQSEREELPTLLGLLTNNIRSSKTWLGGSKSYTGGTAAREFRRRRILQVTAAYDADCLNPVVSVANTATPELGSGQKYFLAESTFRFQEAALHFIGETYD